MQSVCEPYQYLTTVLASSCTQVPLGTVCSGNSAPAPRLVTSFRDKDSAPLAQGYKISKS
ncbi:uncharacterized protein PHACADRAFT_250277 [Phanerochaete carnosa HHB-10118-sp]|uniref:Uncharacterized protein n=1 Tax=Phanerochaete carnosa (strain HHB-10118-sp) TaxID=650164 RepID=K5WJQ5_PHACS|nr:uncharacterized protein PHACADRAFT_250277 [Phanerochaete carnosa HHB-10118-sp]EKM59645.1 hypothetical protein PHACADRAFT_250277 [Phanerochaete carnosa HHB-10118-sp]